jgi:hypothetical protein
LWAALNEEDNSMSDREIIERGYQDTVLLVFRRFFEGYTVAQDADARDQVEQSFRRGVLAAREARDRALALLP